MEGGRISKSHTKTPTADAALSAALNAMRARRRGPGHAGALDLLRGATAPGPARPARAHIRRALALRKLITAYRFCRTVGRDQHRRYGHWPGAVILFAQQYLILGWPAAVAVHLHRSQLSKNGSAPDRQLTLGLPLSRP